MRITLHRNDWVIGAKSVICALKQDIFAMGSQATVIQDILPPPTVLFTTRSVKYEAQY